MRTIAWGSQELKNMYDYLNSGHFFDRDTMRFFRSRLTDNYRRLDDRTALFITTEKGPSGVRMATLRIARLIEYKRESDGRLCEKIEIDTVGEFNSMTLYQAKKAMANYQVQS